MQITLKSFGEITVEPRHGNYNVDLVVSGVSAEDLVNGFDKNDIDELIPYIPYEKVVEYHGYEEILNSLHPDDIIKFVKEYLHDRI